MSAFTIGRGQENDIVLTDKSISRQHAELVEKRPGIYQLRDLGSVNGSFCYGSDGWVPANFATLERDDQIRLGTYTTSVGALLDSLKSGPRKGSKDETALRSR